VWIEATDFTIKAQKHEEQMTIMRNINRRDPEFTEKRIEKLSLLYSLDVSPLGGCLLYRIPTVSSSAERIRGLAPQLRYAARVISS
jgi:hypothetical protein